MTDLRQRVPGHSLIDELIRQWELGNIRVDEHSNAVIVKDAHGWYRGVVGERRVATLLEDLEDCTVLHSVPVGSGTTDIDHIVISQAGVFTINTKYSPGRDVWVAGHGMYVGGYPQRYVTNSLAEATKAEEALSRATGMTVPVTGVIVFVDANKFTQKSPPGAGGDAPQIKVVRDVRLLSTLRGRSIFSVEQVARIVDAAVLPETWHRSPAVSTSGASIAREFLALEEALGPQLAEEYAAPVASKRSKTRTPRTNTRTRSRSRENSRTVQAAKARKQARRDALLLKLLGAVTLIIGGLIALNVLTAR